VKVDAIWDPDDVTFSADEITLALYSFIGFSGGVENDTITKYGEIIERNVVSGHRVL